jgi:hypothetical protein
MEDNMRRPSCAIVTLMLAATVGPPAVTAEQAKAAVRQQDARRSRL